MSDAPKDKDTPYITTLGTNCSLCFHWMPTPWTDPEKDQGLCHLNVEKLVATTTIHRCNKYSFDPHHY